MADATRFGLSLLSARATGLRRAGLRFVFFMVSALLSLAVGKAAVIAEKMPAEKRPSITAVTQSELFILP
ncbi:MAG: hypothetical protein ACREB6_12195 [Rhodospirillales bacterium]